jgi:hypothetical protein
MFVYQCAAGLAHVKSNIRSNEAINLSPSPGSPRAAKGCQDAAMIPELAAMSPSPERPTDSTSSPTRVLSRPLVSAGLRLLDSTRSTARSVPASLVFRIRSYVNMFASYNFHFKRAVL